ncbi:PAS domain-containing protein [Snodgrassella communis]|uniref:PAS domain-containing protein n=1 Tax=Snodgrassella communis TaxID=2946699 RepID=UPI001EF53047|nr:PAS domain-containing protein [Snodgrassella communis]
MDMSRWIQPKPESEFSEHKVKHYQQDGESTVYVTNQEFPYPDGALIVSRTDLDGIITHANDVFVDISGWTRDEIIGAPHCLLRHPDMPKAPFADMWATLQRGERWYGYVKNLRKDGGHYWVYATVIPNLRQGKVIGYSSIRRKPSRERINEMSALYAEMLKNEQEGK